MAWVRLDDGFFGHRKVLELTNSAKLLFVAALCHCNGQLTDGFVSTGAARALTGSLGMPAKVLAELVDRGFLHKREDGYEVHDYLRYQAPAEQIRREREAARERVRRRRSGDVRANIGRTSGDVQANGRPNTGRSSDEVRPPPTPTNYSLSVYSDSRPPGDPETEREPEGENPLVGRVLALLRSAGGKPDPGEVRALVGWALSHLDVRFVDEIVGGLALLGRPPQRVAYLATTIRQRAGQASPPIAMPPFDRQGASQ